ncbi:Zn-ribbon domain-containing OB-fold protein [Planosporangium sp. 12N6]|uniref:Zn-ribbon domain-containing OB-fold protein n=1 Tax=Planosporangium spinosum TaxID=3402278 RepID=UPI003CFA1253
MNADMGLVPVVDDPDTGGFFAAAAEHRLAVQTCADCGNRQQPPRPRCVECHGAALEWRDVPGTGRLHSWTVVEHQINPRFPAPYTVVLVDVVPDEGEKPVRFLGHLPGRPEVAVGDRLRVVFQPVADGVTLPNWELDKD